MAVSAALVCCVVVGASAAAADRPTAILQSVTGTPAIFELSSGELRHASSVGIGRHYELPMEIETGKADAATFLLPNSVIEVSPNSLMRIVAPEGDDAGVVQRVLQQTGSSLFRVQRGTIDRFQVETPFLVSVVKGTVFNVLVRGDGATVSLQEGRLLVNSLDASQSVELAPGDVAFAGRDGALRMLKLELTGSGVKARESLATNNDTKATDVSATDSKGAVSNDASTVVRAPDSVGTAVGQTTATVASVVVDGVVDPVRTDVVDPVVDSVVEPVVDTVVAPGVDRLVDNTVGPVIDTVAVPVIDNIAAPVMDNVVAPVAAPVVGGVGGAVSTLVGRN